MPVYYDAQAVLPGIQWSKTVYPRVLRSPQLWLCLAVHGTLVVLLREGHLELPEEHGALVPAELVGALLLLALLGTGVLTLSCQRWHQAVTDACARVGEQTRLFVQELQATFGRADEVLALRFAAAKYALAGVYLFFFAITGGAVTARAWGELRAKGLLDDREVQFLESQYAGDRIALLHVWATWAAQEAALAPSARELPGGRAQIAGGLGRLAGALQGAAAAAREAAGLAAAPVPQQTLQLQSLASGAALLALAAAAAPAAASARLAASAAYATVLFTMLGLREGATLLLDPLREGHGFPVSAAVNATADAVAQLLAASTPAAFDPRSSWRDASHAVFSQGQIERRTPCGAFAAGGRGNPYHWQEAKPAVLGDQAPPPLLDVGCCHLDVEALPCVGGGKKHPSKLVLSQRRRQDGAGALIARLRDAGSREEGNSTSAPSEAGSDARPCLPPGSGSGRSSELSLGDTPGLGHPSLAGASRAYRGHSRASKGAPIGCGEREGTWAKASEEPRTRGASSTRVSPGELGPNLMPPIAPGAKRQLQL